MILLGDYNPGAREVRFKPSQQIHIANLEGPILAADHNLPICLKAGPNIFSSTLPSSDNQLVFSLANNHSMDYGMEGLRATIDNLKQRFKYGGAGESLIKARQPIIVEDKGMKIGILFCCEAQFGIAQNKRPGVAEFGPWIYGAIRQLKSEADAVIVSVHASVEDSPWPSPFISDLYKSFIAAGARVVHGHHSHVPQGYEEYGNGLIFYGMGNFAVDPTKWRDYPNGTWSLAAEVDLNNSNMKWRLLTLEHCEKGGASNELSIRESGPAERDIRLNYLEKCNLPLQENELFHALWHEVSLRCYYYYAAQYMGLPSYKSCRKSLFKQGLSEIKLGVRKVLGSITNHQHSYLLAYNMLACESHRQVLLTALGILGGEIEDLRTTQSQLLADEMMPWSRGVVPE